MGYLQLVTFQRQVFPHGFKVCTTHIQMSVVMCFSPSYPSFQDLGISTQFVSHAHHKKRGVIAVGIKQALKF